MNKAFITIAILVCSACQGQRPVVISGREGKTLPSFDLLLMDSTTRINTGNIPVGKPMICILLDPYCPICRAETEDIIQNIQSISGIHIYLMSSYPFSFIKDYYKHFNLDKYPSITVCQDFTNSFGPFYNVPGVPYITVFNRQKKLKQALIGRVDTDLFEKIINE